MNNPNNKFEKYINNIKISLSKNESNPAPIDKLGITYNK